MPSKILKPKPHTLNPKPQWQHRQLSKVAKLESSSSNVEVGLWKLNPVFMVQRLGLQGVGCLGFRAEGSGLLALGCQASGLSSCAKFHAMTQPEQSQQLDS